MSSRISLRQTRNVQALTKKSFTTKNTFPRSINSQYESSQKLSSWRGLFGDPKDANAKKKALMMAGGSGADSPQITKLLENNKKWVKEMSDADPNFFPELGKGQAPKYLYFGCSDSRVPATTILGLRPGEVFVHRNVGNLVPGNNLSALCVLEYAVTHLGVTDIIVTGHYKCGAVMASTMRQDLGLLEHWLRSIRDVSRMYQKELSLITDENERHEKLVEFNVIEQCLTLYKTGPVQRKRMEVLENFERLNGPVETEIQKQKAIDFIYPRIHGLVFDPAVGLLKTLPVDFKGRIGALDEIYGLY